MTRPLVLVTETLDPAAADWLGERAEVVFAPDTDPRLAEADALIVRTYTQVNDTLLERAPKLRVVGRAGVGLDNIDLPACRRRGIPVVYTPDANTQAVVEYVLGLMLDHFRPRTDLPPNSSAQDFHQLRKTQVGRQLDTMTLGIVGFGRIGKRLGEVAHAIGMNLIVTDLLPEAQLRKAVDYPFQFVDHAKLYAKSDIVTLHTDGRAENRHFIDAAALAHFRDGALLINAARGMLIDHAALAGWLRDHPQAHAILDVHDPEPPEVGGPLAGVSNVRLLPHLASRTHVAMANMSNVVHDIAAVLDGREPRYPA